MDVKIEPHWKELLKDEFSQSYFQQIVLHLKTEKTQNKIIYPPGSQIFNAFDTTPIDKVKVVILGQDPYHGAGQAHDATLRHRLRRRRTYHPEHNEESKCLGVL